jgi:hypothetical protein
MFLAVAVYCKTRIPKPFSLLRLAQSCRALRPQWCQSGVKMAQGVARRVVRRDHYLCLKVPH